MEEELIYLPQEKILINLNTNLPFEINEFNEKKRKKEILKIMLNLNNLREFRYNQETENIVSFDEFINVIHKKYEKYLQLQLQLIEKKKELELLRNKLQTSNNSNEDQSQSQLQTQSINWKELVLQEERLRLSSEIAEKYQQTETDESLIDWIEYTARHVQPRILQENGLEVTPENLYKLRAAAQQTDVFWIKYNRARRGELKVDDTIPSNVVLYDPSITQHLPLISISQSTPRSRPLVLLAGSVS